MKETPLSTCERAALTEMVGSGLRHDRRAFLEARSDTISFGREYGSCSVTLGETRVLAQVTGQVVEPRPSRPNEGKLSLSVHLSPMAAPHLELGRGGGVPLVEALHQVLERNIKDSRCLDLESLCIRAEESVWQLRVDITILNHGGNLGDAANMAAVAALRHFHRPDVAVEEDGRVTILTHAQSQPIPTFMRKVPVCVTYALVCLDDQCLTLMDPTHLEERVMTGRLVAGLNPHGDITSLVFPGRVALKKAQVMMCLNHAFVRAKAVAERIQRAVEEDLEARLHQEIPQGFINCLVSDEVYKKERFIQLMKSKGLVIPKKSLERATPMDEETTTTSDNAPEGSGMTGSDDATDQLEEESRTWALATKATRAPGSRQRVTVVVPEEVKIESDSEEEQEQETLTSQDLQ